MVLVETLSARIHLMGRCGTKDLSYSWSLSGSHCQTSVVSEYAKRTSGALSETGTPPECVEMCTTLRASVLA